jgi:hypothetical protein
VPREIGERYLVLVDIVYSHALMPFPRIIDLTDSQYVRFYGNVLCPSPYETIKQKTKLTYLFPSIQHSANSNFIVYRRARFVFIHPMIRLNGPVNQSRMVRLTKTVHRIPFAS